MFDFTNLIVSNFIFGLHVFFPLRLVTGCVCSLEMATAEGQNITFETAHIFDIFMRNYYLISLTSMTSGGFTRILSNAIFDVVILIVLHAYYRQ